MLRKIAKPATLVAAVVAAAVGGHAGTMVSASLGLAAVWSTFASLVLAGAGLLAVGFTYYWLFLRGQFEEDDDELPEDAAVRAYSSMERR